LWQFGNEHRWVLFLLSSSEAVDVDVDEDASDDLCLLAAFDTPPALAALQCKLLLFWRVTALLAALIAAMGTGVSEISLGVTLDWADPTTFEDITFEDIKSFRSFIRTKLG
jgi:hypothetical protein